MSGRMHQILLRCFGREERVPISASVHFCAFRYGCGDYNPYETYATALARGDPVGPARARFVEFLRHYRPAHFGEALGVQTQRMYPLWFYPWSRRAGPVDAGWLDGPDDCPDILTHFSQRGVARRRIDQEFAWLERALASIREYGFQPQRFRSRIIARRLMRQDGCSAWLLLDGNHRVAALSALGHTHVTLKHLPGATVREARLARWQQVRRAAYEAADAKTIFQAYFNGNQRPRTTDLAAPILEGDT
jgi:hypothetical protein